MIFGVAVDNYDIIESCLAILKDTNRGGFCHKICQIDLALKTHLGNQ